MLSVARIVDRTSKNC